MKPRVLGLSISGALLGAMRGYYIAEKPLQFGYKFGIVSGAMSSTFYLGSHLLEHYRDKDDAINHCASGFLNFTAVSLLMKGDSYMPGVSRGLRHTVAGILGTISGLVLYYGGSLLFDTSRYCTYIYMYLFFSFIYIYIYIYRFYHLYLYYQVYTS